MAEIREVTRGLEFPEGPIAMDDGSVVLVEIKRGTLTRVLPDGTQKIVANTGGGPNGAAIGPDGKVYICNNGGFEWREGGGLTLPGNQPADYKGGSIQRVDLETGAVETLYTECDGIPLKGAERPCLRRERRLLVHGPWQEPRAGPGPHGDLLRPAGRLEDRREGVPP